MRENLSRLEGEKKSNNFGKYEKDRMKVRISINIIVNGFYLP